MAIVLFIAGLVLLVLGAEALVRGASRLAAVFGISPLVIGLTVVAFGTSAPELAVGIKAALSSQAGIALGNVVGSNLFNLMGVLGLSSIAAPAGIEVSTAVIRLDLPIMIVVSFACLPVFFTGGIISRREGASCSGTMWRTPYTSFWRHPTTRPCPCSAQRCCISPFR
ncbi:Inner membrane protein YrbG [Pontiella desulfatans]|uniref:Inner membrane protein YrbG n=1 Tax=Pontiella desulfatans TaxID=2750659 RepID=A0A6C2UBG2_PONDE|nr:hypothetical protein [Pontiella desulfatans]VGO16781.1 Inner membrane protein YrbG [Pontiella desulfatans]